MDLDKTLFVSDLDGTLLNANAEISKTTRFYLNQMIAKGLHFSVATARTATSALNMLQGLHGNDPVILLNGVLFYDLKKKHYINTIPIPP